MRHDYIAKRYWNIQIPALSKTNEMVKRYDDVIDLSIGDPDYPADESVIEAMYQDALAGHTKYTAFLGDEELRAETCRWYAKDYNCHYDMDNVMITAGGTHAMYLVLESLLDEGDEVILFSPYYIYYVPQIELARGKAVIIETSARTNFEIDLEAFEKAITPRTKAIIVNSPNNPTGRVYKEETIQRLIELADQYDFVVIADDIYAALNFTDRRKPICAYAPNNPRIVTIYSYSKDYSMTGFRLGHIIAEKHIIECVRNVNEGVSFTISAMIQRCGIYALKHRSEIQAGLYEEYRKRVFYAYERINNIPNMSCEMPEGTFYLFVDIRKTGLTSEEMWELMLDEAHVLVLPGSGFGSAGDGYIRIACTSGIERLGEAFDRISRMEVFKARL